MHLHALIVCLALGPAVVHAELKDENLLQGLPPGYKVDFQTRQGNMLMTEFVPQNENVNAWTEMVTTQVFLGLRNADISQIQSRITKGWLEVCKGGTIQSLANGEENGYPFSLWMQTCPVNPATGKPENTWFKAIAGSDSLYMVQKAFKFQPSKDQLAPWIQYLKNVKVCDTRRADRPCPKVEPVTAGTK